MKKDSWSVALRVMVNVSGWIAGPIIIGLFLGKWLDKKFNTAPWLFLITIGVCFLVSMYGLVVNALKEFKKVEKDYQEDKIEGNHQTENKTEKSYQEDKQNEWLNERDKNNLAKN